MSVVLIFLNFIFINSDKTLSPDMNNPIDSNKLLVAELTQSLIETTEMESVSREKMLHKERSTQTSTFESKVTPQLMSKPSTSSSNVTTRSGLREKKKPPKTDDEIRNKIYERNNDPKLAPNVDCQVIIEAIKDGREKTEKSKPSLQQSSTATSIPMVQIPLSILAKKTQSGKSKQLKTASEKEQISYVGESSQFATAAVANKRPSTTQIDQPNPSKKLKVINEMNVASNSVGGQSPDGTNHPFAAAMETESAPQFNELEPDAG